jgi:disulfide bond formation protein DsbB
MSRIKPHYFSLLLLLASAFTLAAAYVAEYGFGLKPCHLCLLQRIPYAVSIMLSLLALLSCRSLLAVKALQALCGISFLVGAGIAFYHTGVELHIFEGLTSCAGQEKLPATVEEMRQQLLNTPAVRCDVPAFMFMGLSMAGWNMLWSGTLGIMTLYYVLRKRG